MAEATPLTDRRVLFQYLDPQGYPHFEFTTVLSASEEHARVTIASVHENDFGFEIVQVVDSNGSGTGYTAEQQAEAIVYYAARDAEHGRVD